MGQSSREDQPPLGPTRTDRRFLWREAHGALGPPSNTYVLAGFENRFGKQPVHIGAPLILISLTHGESTSDDRYWLQTSAQASQMVLEGGIETIDTQADKIAEQILSLGRR